MNEADIIVGHVYRGKQFREFFGQTNDRIVIYIGDTWKGKNVQYDSDTVGLGRHYPTVTMEQFLKWAKKDLTSEEKKESET